MDSCNKSLSDKSLGVWVGKVRVTSHTMKSIQPVLPKQRDKTKDKGMKEPKW